MWPSLWTYLRKLIAIERASKPKNAKLQTANVHEAAGDNAF